MISYKVDTSRSYSIVMGRNIVEEEIKKSITDKYDYIGIFTNNKIYDIYKEFFDNLLEFDSRLVLFKTEDGEQYKNYSYAEKFLNGLLKKGFSRSSLLVAVGGGVIGDFTGYLASLFMRGIEYIQVPTTHLAMVDSSIGGKVAVNIDAGKNIVGAFYPPIKVITDFNFLKTLNDEEFKCGLAETIKHGFLGVPEIIDIIEKNSFEELKSEGVIDRLLEISSAFKIKIVTEDETEKGLRAILNFGHTVGHAIESWMNYTGILHGEAVAIGIKVAAEFSKEMNLLSDSEFNKINNLIDKFDLGVFNQKFDVDEIISQLKFDKKIKHNVVKFVLLNGLYNPVFDQDVDNNLIKKVLLKY